MQATPRNARVDVEDVDHVLANIGPSVVLVTRPKSAHAWKALHRPVLASSTDAPKAMAPTMLHVGALQDHQAGYIRRALRSLMSSITARDLAQTVARLRYQRDHMRRESARRPAPPCATRLAAGARPPTVDPRP